MLREKSELARREAHKRKLRLTLWDYFIHVVLMGLAALAIAMALAMWKG